MKKVSRFDDQHQPMSPWLEKLADDESSNFSDADLRDEPVVERPKVAYTGISSTWDKKSDATGLSYTGEDLNRRVSNRPQVLASADSIEKEARQLMMTGLSLEKIASILKKKYEQAELKAFNISKLEPEYGKLGHIYVDASLVENCGDISTIMKNASHVSSIAIRSVKRCAKCENCSLNKGNNCIKLGLRITDDAGIKSVGEAKFILNKFASLKYINSYFVKSSELTRYYNRLATEDPGKVVSDFLVDINSRRVAKQRTNSRIAAKETIADKLEGKKHIIKFGREDVEVANAFKQMLLKTSSIRTVKSELVKKYSKERVEGFLKESREDLRRYVNFLHTKPLSTNSRDAVSKEASSTRLENRKSSQAVENATKMAYLLRTLRQPIEMIKVAVVKMFSDEVASDVISKLAADREAQMIGLTHIDSNLYSSASELQQVLPTLNRRANGMIFQVKEGPLCKLADNPTGVCKITGLKIVKSAAVDSRRQAARVIDHVKSVKLANGFEIDRVASKLKDDNNTDTIRLFLTASIKNNKRVSSTLVKQVTDVALKYAKNINVIRKMASTSWSSLPSLLRSLNSQVTNRVAFETDLKSAVDKSANDASVFLKQANQYDVDIFSPDKDTVSDVTLGKTI